MEGEIKMKSSTVRRHTVIKSKGRFVTFVVFMVIMLAGIMTFAMNMTSSVDAIEDSNFKTVEVGYGDTLWDIAAVNKSEGTDIRQAVYAICDENDICASDLQPGMKIVIPMDRI